MLNTRHVVSSFTPQWLCDITLMPILYISESDLSEVTTASRKEHRVGRESGYLLDLDSGSLPL